MLRFLSLSAILLFSNFSISQQLIINEVSQGSGSSEYVEFVVIGSPSCISPVPCVDLRKVIVDDNNGYFAPGSGTGIASGAVRFGNISFWQCIPQGTIIVVYNNTSPNSSLPPDDLSMTDGNCRLIIPASSNLLEKTSVSPTSSVPTYPPDSDWNTGGVWSNLAMNNTDDSFQIPDLSNNGVPLHGISWGNNTNGSIIYFTGSASGKVFSFTNAVSNDWNNQANWASGNVPANETPGAPNSSQNDAWIGSMNPQCGVSAGMTLSLLAANESCVNACDGSINSSVSNGAPPYSYNWSSGETTANLTNLCPGNYSLEVIGSNGCSVIESITITAGSVQADASIQGAGPFEETDAIQQINSLNSGGIWTASCGSCINSSGVFSPQTAGAGTWDVCYQLGTGNCSDSDCISIVVTPACPPQITSETQFICDGDSILVFGNWIQSEGEYSQSFQDLNGCDSTHLISVYNYFSDDLFETITICEFDSTFVFGDWYFDSHVVTQIEQTQEGCLYERIVTIIRENCIVDSAAIYIPNVFTPNGDMINDVFRIEILGGQIEEGYIFNRWGNVIFKFDSNNLVWDGYDTTSGHFVQDGVYTYLVYFKPAESNRESYNGFVTLIR